MRFKIITGADTKKIIDMIDKQFGVAKHFDHAVLNAYGISYSDGLVIDITTKEEFDGWSGLEMQLNSTNKLEYVPFVYEIANSSAQHLICVLIGHHIGRFNHANVEKPKYLELSAEGVVSFTNCPADNTTTVFGLETGNIKYIKTPEKAMYVSEIGKLANLNKDYVRHTTEAAIQGGACGFIILNDTSVLLVNNSNITDFADLPLATVNDDGSVEEIKHVKVKIKLSVRTYVASINTLNAMGYGTLNNQRPIVENDNYNYNYNYLRNVYWIIGESNGTIRFLGSGDYLDYNDITGSIHTRIAPFKTLIKNQRDFIDLLRILSVRNYIDYNNFKMDGFVGVIVNSDRSIVSLTLNDFRLCTENQLKITDSGVLVPLNNYPLIKGSNAVVIAKIASNIQHAGGAVGTILKSEVVESLEYILDSGVKIGCVLDSTDNGSGTQSIRLLNTAVKDLLFKDSAAYKKVARLINNLSSNGIHFNFVKKATKND